MLWAALHPDLQQLPTEAAPRTDALQGIATWCLQYTPRVAVLEALLDHPAVVMEVGQSVRLFGGKRLLVQRIREAVPDLGVAQLSWAPNSLAALAVGRAGLSNGFAKPLAELLDGLPLRTLTAVDKHAGVLARLGCQTLGQVRSLPRGGMSRRFDKELLAALDQAYGLRPEAHAWVTLPENFQTRLELMARVEHAPAMLFGARRLVLQMAGWLQARRAGVTAFTLRWWHDAMRSKEAGKGGEITVRTAKPTRDTEHLIRLLAEHLDKVKLLAPAGDLELHASEVVALHEASLSMLPEARHDGESLALVLERVAARLGPERVLRPVLLEDHRLEWMCRWQPAPEKRPSSRAGIALGPQPTFILPTPLRLAVKDNRPLYQGVLQLLAGPHRIEGGWWDRVSETVPQEAGDGTLALFAGTTLEAIRQVSRDYWVALSEHAGVLWIFQVRLPHGDPEWFLHGTFA